MNIPENGPQVTRATIKFSNTEPGLFISGAKLATDAKNFRRAARLLQAAGGAEEAKLASWFISYADLCQNAAAGMELVQPAAYDRDTSGDYAQRAIPNDIGD